MIKVDWYRPTLSLSKVRKMGHNRKRLRLLMAMLSIAIVCLIGRVAYLQVFSSDRLAQSSLRGQTQLIPGEDIPRGSIVDRNGVSLTGSEVSLAAVLFPSMLKDPEGTVEKIAEILDTSKAGIKALIRSKSHAYIPNLTEEEFRKVKELNTYGVYPCRIFARYGQDSIARHVVGHVNSIDQSAWAEISRQGLVKEYDINDLIGVKGIEAIYEDYLRVGEPVSFFIAEKDARGNIIPGLSFKEAEGSSYSKQRNAVHLTIDSGLQRKVEEVMDASIKRGAVVVLDVRTGDILAVASRPNYDQNLIGQHLDSSSDDEAFNNRAFECFYPGSVFKILIASAVVEENLVDPEEKFMCTGNFTFDTGLSIGCWEQDGHGVLDFVQGFANSCNPVFIEAGLRLGREKILQYGDRLGLSRPAIIGYPQPQRTCISIDPFGDGKIANAALGQEGVMLSPVQVAGMVSVIASGGYYRTPRLVSKITDHEGNTLESFPIGPGNRVIKPETAAQVQMMLGEAVRNGTGKNAWITGFGSGGKTGSAETGKTGKDGKSVKNVWFAGFVPLQNPRFAIVVMKEEGDSGGGDAAPVFKEIAEYAIGNL